MVSVLRLFGRLAREDNGPRQERYIEEQAPRPAIGPARIPSSESRYASFLNLQLIRGYRASSRPSVQESQPVKDLVSSWEYGLA